MAAISSFTGSITYTAGGKSIEFLRRDSITALEEREERLGLFYLKTHSLYQRSVRFEWIRGIEVNEQLCKRFFIENAILLDEVASESSDRVWREGDVIVTENIEEQIREKET